MTTNTASNSKEDSLWLFRRKTGVYCGNCRKHIVWEYAVFI